MVAIQRDGAKSGRQTAHPTRRCVSQASHLASEFGRRAPILSLPSSFGALAEAEGGLIRGASGIVRRAGVVPRSSLDAAFAAVYQVEGVAVTIGGCTPKRALQFNFRTPVVKLWILGDCVKSLRA